MRTAGIFEAKQKFSSLVDAVEAGEEVQITRHGKVVARMLPVLARPSAATARQVARELRLMQELRSRVRPGPGWKQLRDEGRKY
ncbi:MAG: type II toxin-antitoxin system prevent-host-death family antitoxin [Caldimonas sp.]